LSVVASIAGLVAVSAKIVSLLKDLYDSAKGAPESVGRVKAEMQDLNVIFCEVQLFIMGQSRMPESN